MLARFVHQTTRLTNVALRQRTFAANYLRPFSSSASLLASKYLWHHFWFCFWCKFNMLSVHQFAKVVHKTELDLAIYGVGRCPRLCNSCYEVIQVVLLLARERLPWKCLFLCAQKSCLLFASCCDNYTWQFYASITTKAKAMQISFPLLSTATIDLWIWDTWIDGRNGYLPTPLSYAKHVPLKNW